MKEEILNKATEKLLEYAQSAEMFAKENVPLYIKELLDYALYDNMVNIYLICGAWLVVILVFIAFLVGYIRTEDEVCVDGMIVTTVVAVVIIGTITLMVVPRSIKSIYKIENAPRVYIIEHIRSIK